MRIAHARARVVGALGLERLPHLRRSRDAYGLRICRMGRGGPSGKPYAYRAHVRTRTCRGGSKSEASRGRSPTGAPRQSPTSSHHITSQHITSHPPHHTTPHPIPSRPVPSHPIPSHPIPSHPIPSHPIPSHPIPSHPIPSHPIPSHPIPLHHITSHQTVPRTPDAGAPTRPRAWRPRPSLRVPRRARAARTARRRCQRTSLARAAHARPARRGTSKHTAQHHIPSHHPTPHQTAPQHVTSHRTTRRHTSKFVTPAGAAIHCTRTPTAATPHASHSTARTRESVYLRSLGAHTGYAYVEWGCTIAHVTHTDTHMSNGELAAGRPYAHALGRVAHRDTYMTNRASHTGNAYAHARAARTPSPPFRAPTRREGEISDTGEAPLRDATRRANRRSE